jgi:hypothetical protein
MWGECKGGIIWGECEEGKLFWFKKFETDGGNSVGNGRPVSV